MRRDRLTHDTLGEGAESKTEAIATVRTKIHPKEEESLDCPDCFNTMMELYDWDKINMYVKIVESWLTPSTYVSSGVES